MFATAEFMTTAFAAARKQGVLPIAFHGKEEFVAFDHTAAEEEDETEDDEADVAETK